MGAILSSPRMQSTFSPQSRTMPNTNWFSPKVTSPLILPGRKVSILISFYASSCPTWYSIRFSLCKFEVKERLLQNLSPALTSALRATNAVHVYRFLSQELCKLSP